MNTVWQKSFVSIFHEEENVQQVVIICVFHYEYLFEKNGDVVHEDWASGSWIFLSQI